MTHNSRQPDRRELDAGGDGLTLEQARNAWAYTASCVACHRAGVKGSHRALSWDWLIQRFGADCIVRDVRPRLKCSHCGGKEIIAGVVEIGYYNSHLKQKLQEDHSS